MITGFTVSKVEGHIESADALTKQRFPKLNYNIDSVSGSAEKLKINYEFSATYFDSDAKDAKSIGELKLGGAVEVKDTKENVSSILKKWNDSHMLPPQLAEEILNSLNFRCGATGTLIAYSLGLIPPLVLAATKIEEKK